MTLLRYPKLYGAGQRGESYNAKLFWITMADTLWQSVAAFFLPLFVYWHSTIDASSLADLWTLAVVILVNIHLAMDVIRWTWITHAAIWGSIDATFICVLVIDAIPGLLDYWAIVHLAQTGLFWWCLLGIPIGALIPRFVVKNFVQYYGADYIQIAREAEKFGGFREFGGLGKRGGGGSGDGVGMKREGDPVAEVVVTIKGLGDGFMRLERMKMDMAREVEAMQRDMEMKWIEILLESQERIVEFFGKALSEKRNKKAKRMPPPQA
ncbi:Phospholipid-transporting ATPase 1 [Camellia lanceoleosa]|uniref:Phospholipid-transporting ATPase 1 n=1 Tax=Camellia lanceoleosa TaxID=1840588 RepID=A0ACC0IL74_9ERIC|nr:Phospholipid-transporting ATPase 1 [Camellia lanceoleosa]